MISWQDALQLSRKRWQRRHIFSGLRHSVPLFLLLVLSIVTSSSIFIMIERAYDAAIDQQYPHPSHIRVISASTLKEKPPLTATQIDALKNHQAVQAAMTVIPCLNNFFADFGETRYSPMKGLCGYHKELFELYRTLPKGKDNPDAVPILLGRDLLALSWSADKGRFVRNEQQELTRWLGRSFKIYLNPFGLEQYEPKFDETQTDYARFRDGFLKKRKEKLDELERNNPALARRQDPLFVQVQVVGFIRDPGLGGLTSLLPAESMEQLRSLHALQRDKKRSPDSEEELQSISLLARPGRAQEVEQAIRQQGLKRYHAREDGMFARLWQELRDESDLRLTLWVLSSIYLCVMLVIVYQLLSSQVKDSIREIGLLRCIGAERRDIIRIFTVMNLVRLARIYLLSLASAFVLLLVTGYWLAGPLNLIKPESLAKGSIPDFLICRVEQFSPFWLMAPWWVWLMPVLLLVPVALCAAAIPVWRVMRVQPSEALRD